ncbi:DNA cytosine methyltransferase [uncultured Actinomyces sp.]|uniref:DNA cytosine methyltransferase n=1 Tax=uncultured Actinomyces sp. TaxID=249061 RepID=UPI0028ED2B99|nr:DNA cytosine methyltransferase [uncultured Actinomyces sp.]
MTTIGSLFTGYGGLDMGVAMALDPDARVAWTSDVEPGPCRLAEVRWPDTPNLGDITTIDWADVEPVDIICGGSPCQDLSLAGKRAGMASGTRSGLWESMAAAIETIRPRLVVWENVLGALSARAYSPVESEPWMLGAGTNGPLVRAAGRVVGDLASLGYSCSWRVVRASDAGAPHQRARLFIIGYPDGQPWDVRRPTTPRQAPTRRPQCEPAGPGLGTLMPTPTASDHKAGRHQDNTGYSLTQAVQLLPTPVAQPSGNSPSEHLRKKPGRDRVTDLAIIVENNLLPTGGLLPTPQATYAPRSSPGYGPNLHEAVAATDATFGPYAPAIARWEQVTGRQAPPPTNPPRREGGKPQLSARFVEWLMGLPDGHVTGPDLDLSRKQQLRMLGNGVVPQQAALAVSSLIQTIKDVENANV